MDASATCPKQDAILFFVFVGFIQRQKLTSAIVGGINVLQSRKLIEHFFSHIL